MDFVYGLYIYANTYHTSLDTGRNPNRPLPVGVMTGMSKQQPDMMSQVILFLWKIHAALISSAVVRAMLVATPVRIRMNNNSR
jgi:hypothetical protein